jgi:uroporphyrinogen-III synthase
MAMPVLVTRPEPGASATGARLAARGFRPVLAPLLTVEILPHRLPAAERLRAVVIASQQAIPALPAAYDALPLYAVGDATAAAARARGFTQVMSASGNAVDLAALISRELPKAGRPLLLAAGVGQGDQLKEMLQAYGFEVIRDEVYAARPVTRLPLSANQLLQGDESGWTLLFSRETALCFRRLCHAANLSARLARFRLAAISAPVADAVRDLPWAAVHVAMEPNETAVLALLNE